MRVLDLFSGIGGMSLGLQMADPQFKTMQFVEIDDYCRQVLELRWPGVPLHDDVRTFTARFGRYDLVTAGYPCQPFSQAGKRAGAEDDRHLWPEVNRILAECRPTWFLGENVAGHISMGLDDVLSDLEGQGYTARALVIPACAVDAPHRRDRVWIIAAKDDANADGKRLHRAQFDKQREAEPADGQERVAGSVREVLAGRGDASERGAKAVGHASRSRPQAFDWRGAGPQFENGCADVANAEDNGLQRLRNLTESNPAGSRQKQPLGDSDESGDGSDASGQGLSPSKQEEFPATRRGQEGRTVAQPCRWSPEPAVRRVAHGVPRRVDRLKGLGNSVVPQVVAMLARTIISADR